MWISSLPYKVTTMNFRWLVDVFIDWIIISIAIICACKFWFLLPFCIYVVGNRQHALLIIGHDSTHKLVSRNKYVNYFCGNLLCFAPCGLGWEGYRDFHMLHHRWLGTEKDPELLKKDLTNCTKDNLCRKYLAKQFVKDLLFLNYKDLVHFSTARSKTDWISIIIVHSVIISLGFVNAFIPLVWYTASTSSLLATGRLRVFHEHVATEGTHLIEPTWISKILFLPHNAAYHHEHHEKPSIPYHLLPLHAEEGRKYVSQINKSN